MKRILVTSIIITACSCAKQSPQMSAENQLMTQSELEISKNRTKELNTMERGQIEDWMKTQNIKYYPMGMNYWINIPRLDHNPRKNNGEKVSYQYYLYDFDRTKIYAEPVENVNAEFGRFNELDAVEDALRYMKKGEEAELLIPSVLAYGTYGDQKKISNDVPLIIKLKVL